MVDYFSGDSAELSAEPPSAWMTDWIIDAQDDEIMVLMAQLSQHAPFSVGTNAEQLVERILVRIVERSAAVSTAGTVFSIDSVMRAELSELYGRMEAKSCCRHHLLSLLIQGRTPEDLSCFAELVIADPPSKAVDAALVFLALSRLNADDVSALFPGLLGGLEHAQLAAPILDLANYFTRRQFFEQHPAEGRGERLAALLGTVVGRLAQWEEAPPQDPQGWQRVRDQVNDGVALAVSLCDTLSFIGNEDCIGKLLQALELGHRRVRVEAAAALSRLGEKQGTMALVEMADDPSTRLRVLHYVEELEIADQIDPRYASAEARAEAELVCYLAEPIRFGIAPQSIELIDQRDLFWPGYDESVVCFLFRYEYRLAEESYSNVGIAGPMVHALTADLADLSLDNIYSVYAGVQTEHEEIVEVSPDHLSGQLLSQSRYLEQKSSEAGYSQLNIHMLGVFFDEPVLVALAQSNGQSGILVTDERDSFWYPNCGNARPLGPIEAYSIYKGRKMLEMFNSR